MATSAGKRNGARITLLTRMPQLAQDVAPEVKLTFVRDFLSATGENQAVIDALTATIPLFVNKDPSNPASE